MSPVAWIVVAGVALAGIALAWGPVAVALSRAQKKSECAALRSQLAAARVQGTDVGVTQALEARLIQCSVELEELGVEVDRFSETLARCDAAQTQIDQEWSHYKSTSYADPLKRENTRTAILRIAEDQARCYGEAIAAAQTEAEVMRVIASISRARAQAVARRNCYLGDGVGCGRFGISEPHGADKGRDEKERVIDPLTAQLFAARARLETLGGAPAPDPAPEAPIAAVTRRRAQQGPRSGGRPDP